MEPAELIGTAKPEKRAFYRGASCVMAGRRRDWTAAGLVRWSAPSSFLACWEILNAREFTQNTYLLLP